MECAPTGTSWLHGRKHRATTTPVTKKHTVWVLHPHKRGPSQRARPKTPQPGGVRMTRSATRTTPTGLRLASFQTRTARHPHLRFVQLLLLLWGQHSCTVRHGTWDPHTRGTGRASTANNVVRDGPRSCTGTIRCAFAFFCRGARTQIKSSVSSTGHDLV